MGISSFMHCLIGLLKKRKKAKTDHSGSKPKEDGSKALSQPESPQAPPAASTHGTEDISVVNTAAVGA